MMEITKYKPTRVSYYYQRPWSAPKVEASLYRTLESYNDTAIGATIARCQEILPPATVSAVHDPPDVIIGLPLYLAT